MSCGTSHDEIQKTLQVKHVEKFKFEEVSDKLRFNDTITSQQFPENPDAQKTIEFDYQLPEGWTEAPKSDFKQINIVLSEEPKADCYLTILPLKGGEILPNLNRWRAQFDLPPLNSPAEQTNESILFIEKQTSLFNISGNFKSLKEAGKDYVSFCLIQSDDQNSYSFKFIGPGEFILKEKNNLISFLESIKIRVKNVVVPKIPSTNLPIIPDSIIWETPKTWVQGEQKAQRVATFKPQGKDGPECYIAVFGGGILENINRWRIQMNLPSIASIEDQELVNFTAPLGSGVAIFVEGNYTGGMTGAPIENAMLAGAIILGSNKTVFVKMVGTKTEVLNEKESFLQLTNSLKNGSHAK